MVKHGVDDAAKLMDVEVQYQAPQTFDMVAMAQLIDAAVASKRWAGRVGRGGARVRMRAAVAAGIPVISMDPGSTSASSARCCTWASTSPSGLAAGEKMKALGKSSGACVNMEVGNVALDQRCQGFADALDGKSQVIATSNDPTEIRAGVTGYLKQHPEIDAVLTAGATAFDPTLAAIEEAGLGEQIALGLDLSPTMLKAIDEDRALFGIDAQQYLTGYYPVIFLAVYDKYGMVPVSNVLTGPLFVTKDTAKEVIELSAQGYR